jgi:hypothetical protein
MAEASATDTEREDCEERKIEGDPSHGMPFEFSSGCDGWNFQDDEFLSVSPAPFTEFL